jgi:hypothetical protein
MTARNTKIIFIETVHIDMRDIRVRGMLKVSGEEEEGKVGGIGERKRNIDKAMLRGRGDMVSSVPDEELIRNLKECIELLRQVKILLHVAIYKLAVDMNTQTYSFGL